MVASTHVPESTTPIHARSGPEHCCSDRELAELLVGTMVGVYFDTGDPDHPKKLYVGEVHDFDEWAGHEPALLHGVKFEDRDGADYTYEQILLYHECYLDYRGASGDRDRSSHLARLKPRDIGLCGAEGA